MSTALVCISISLLLERIRDHGVPDKLLKLLKFYQAGREYIVQYGGYSSKPFIPISQTTQDSNLSPVTFIAYVKQIKILLRVFILFYADDAKLFFPVNTIKNCVKLQMNLDIFCNWRADNLLDFNAFKCMVMSFTGKS